MICEAPTAQTLTSTGCWCWCESEAPWESKDGLGAGEERCSERRAVTAEEEEHSCGRPLRDSSR